MLVGGNAVAAWVARVDVEAVSNAKNADLLVRWQDLNEIKQVLSAAGFVHQFVNGIDLFLDGPSGSVRSAIHLLFAGEFVRPDHVPPAPDITETEPGQEFQFATLEALLRMKLTAFRLKDPFHLHDLLDVGLLLD